MADKVRIGIIGAGGIFRSRHFPGLAKIGDAEVVAICNRSEASAGAIAREFGLSPRLMSDPYALIGSEDVDAVMIGTWPYRHCEYVLASLDAGKHVFVQARMAMNLREAKAMYARAQETGLVTQICPSPMAMKGDWFIQRLIREGYLGDIYHVYTRSFSGDSCDPDNPLHWRQIDRYSGLNALNMGILVEIVQRWAGQMKTISAHAETFIRTRPLDTVRGRDRWNAPIRCISWGRWKTARRPHFCFPPWRGSAWIRRWNSTAARGPWSTSWTAIPFWAGKPETAGCPKSPFRTTRHASGPWNRIS